MKFFAAYWILGCIFVGIGAGQHENRCPNDPYATAQEYFFAVATWPGGVAWAITNPTLSACKIAAPPRT